MKKLFFLSLCLFPIICQAAPDLDLLEKPMDQLRNIHVEKTQNFSKLTKNISDAPFTSESNFVNIPSEAKSQIKPSYFQAIKRAELERCDAGEVQLDSICQTALLHYQNYLSAVAENLTSQQCAHFYTLHRQAVEHYVVVYQLIAHKIH